MSCRMLARVGTLCNYFLEIVSIRYPSLISAVRAKALEKKNGNQVQFIKKSAVLSCLSKLNVKILCMKLFWKQRFPICKPIFEKNKCSRCVHWHCRINLCDTWQARKGRPFIMGSAGCPWIASQAALLVAADELAQSKPDQLNLHEGKRCI